MKKYLYLLLIFGALLGTQSCNRGMSCPTYKGAQKKEGRGKANEPWSKKGKKTSKKGESKLFPGKKPY